MILELPQVIRVGREMRYPKLNGCSNMHLRFLQSLFERVDDKLRQQL